MNTIIRLLFACFLFIPASLIGLIISAVFLHGIFSPYLSSMYGSNAYLVEILLDETGTRSPAMASTLFAVLLPWSAETQSLIRRVIYGTCGIFLTVILSIGFALLVQGGLGAGLAIIAPVLIVRKLIFGEFYKTNSGVL